MGRQEMKVAVDTNVLVRAVVRDDPAQAVVAATVLTDAELIAVALPCLCEFVCKKAVALLTAQGQSTRLL